MTEPEKKSEPVELFIGRFEIVDDQTGVATGVTGYIAILLGEHRVAQIRTSYFPTLQPLIDEIKRNSYWLSAAHGKTTFEPAQSYQHDTKDQAVVTTALTLDEIDRVQVALGRY